MKINNNKGFTDFAATARYLIEEQSYLSQHRPINNNVNLEHIQKEANFFSKKNDLSFDEKLRMKCLLKIFYLYKKSGKNVKFLNADKKMFERFLRRDFTGSKKLDAVVGLKDCKNDKHYHRVKSTFRKQKQLFVAIEPKVNKNRYDNFTYYHDELDNKQQQFYFRLFSSFENRK